MSEVAVPSSPTRGDGGGVEADDDLLDRAWRLSPAVSVRPEPFGALLYSFRTRRLSFLKDRRLLDVVEQLHRTASAREACAAAGLPVADVPVYARALRTLATTQMIEERS